jgi:hypothetical protein
MANLMERHLISALCFLLFASSIDAVAKSHDVLLEAYMFGGGMVAVRGEHLYLRVYDDGSVEYSDEILKNGHAPRYVVRRYKVELAELRSFAGFLKSSGVRSLAKNYPPAHPPLDHTIRLTVSIAQSNDSQTIAIENFFPTSSDAKGRYPAELVELLCRIERLRNKASFQIATNASAWCRR